MLHSAIITKRCRVELAPGAVHKHVRFVDEEASEAQDTSEPQATRVLGVDGLLRFIEQAAQKAAAEAASTSGREALPPDAAGNSTQVCAAHPNCLHAVLLGLAKADVKQ